MSEQLARLMVPLPRPDPRGPVVSVGQPQPDWRSIGPDGMSVERGEPPAPPAPNYGMSDHIIAALRAIFEGTRYREELMRAGHRDPSGLYDKRR